MIFLDLYDPWKIYEFNHNKGYGTKQHISALRQHGFCNHHRKTFKPVKNLCQNQN